MRLNRVLVGKVVRVVGMIGLLLVAGCGGKTPTPVPQDMPAVDVAGESAKAEAQLKRGNELLRKQPDQDDAIAAHYELGLDPREEYASTMRDLDLTIWKSREEIRVNPQAAQAYHDLGAAWRKKESAKLLGQEKDWDTAIAAHREAIRLDPSSEKYLNGLTMTLELKGDLEGAIEAYEQSTLLDSNNAETYNNLGLLRAKHANRKVVKAQMAQDLAVMTYQKAITLNPNEPRYHVNLGEILSLKGDIDGAVRAYRNAVRLDRTNASAYSKLGDALSKSSDWDGAIAAYRVSIRLEPKNHLHSLGLGSALYGKGDLDGAIVVYREITRASGSGLYFLRNALSDKGDWDGALAVYREEVKKNPYYRNDNAQVAEILTQTGDWAEAEDVAKRMDDRYSKGVSAQTVIGFARGGRGDIEGAIEALDEALQFKPNDRWAHFYKGWVLAKAGRKAEAVMAYRRVLELLKTQPENWYARTAAAAIQKLEQ